MLVGQLIFALLVAAASAGKRCLQTNDCSPLDDYVWREDNSGVYSYYLRSSTDMGGYTTHIINMTSQVWFDETVSSSPIWWHTMAIHIPHRLNFNDAALLWIGKSNNDGTPPGATGDYQIERTGQLALATGMVSAVIKNVPNQPMRFYLYNRTTIEKTEDAIISYTWRVFGDEVKNDDVQLGPDFLLRCPMTKAAVRAMDTVTSFVRETASVSTDIQRFIVAGESKRGWTTWTTAATDDRVVAQVPIVLSSVNFVPVFNHYYQALGNWSFALFDYWLEGLMGRINDPEILDLAAVEDPYVYRHRYAFPSFVISGSSDEFFMNDDSHYWYNDMPAGHFRLWNMENTQHEIEDSPNVEDFWHNLESYTYAVLTDWNLPQPQWVRNETDTHGSITVRTAVPPKRISAYHADSPDITRRDWRVYYDFPDIKERNVTWLQAPVEDLGGGYYQAEFAKPPAGFTCFFIKMVFDGPNGRELTFTTESHIIPDVFLYPQCEGYEQCQGRLV